MKKTSRKQLRILRRRRLALALVGAMAMPGAALAQTSCSDCLPYYGQVVSGSASSNYSSGGVIRPNTDANDSTMTVTQTSHGAIIDWGSFNIGTGYEVRFVVPDSSAVTLNRVVSLLGPGYAISSSLIDGAMASNGNVFIINPAGITFGGGAQVNVGGLLASTLWMNSGDFINGLATGQFVFSGFNGDTSATHQVRNNGDIVAGAGGVGLVGPTVWNRGSITSNGGNIVAGAGTQVTVDMVGDGLTQVTINVPPTVDSAIIQDSFGSMTADGGQILLRTAATAAGTGGAIYASGLLRAQSIANVNGRVELTSSGGQVMLGAPGIFSDAGSPYTYGNIDVSGGIGETGGSVLISGNGVTLVNDDDNPYGPTGPTSNGSRIDATGRAGGGNITITSTGDITALQLTNIDASGVVDGSGGTVNLSANGGSANLFGGIGAASGKVSGDGGRINISALDDITQDNGFINANARGIGGQIGLVTNNGDILLTDVDAYGNMSGGSVVATSGSAIRLYGDVNADGYYGDGGSISLIAQGRVYGYGTLDASGGVNGGIVSVSSDYLGSDGSAIDLNGTIDVSGYSGDGGSATLGGVGSVRFEGVIYAGGGVNGGDIGLYSSDGSYGGVLAEGTLYAVGDDGDGGSITIDAAGGVRVQGDMLAWGGTDGGAISITGSYVDFDAAIAYGDTGMGGSVSVTADNIYILGDSAVIDVQGDTGGGSINMDARYNFVLAEDHSLNADAGSSGSGGSINIYGGDSVIIYGDLSARGVDGGGSIYTGTGGYLDLNGIGIDAGTQTGEAGTWTISAPSMVVINGDDQGSVGADTYYVPTLTTRDIQDGDINNAFATGTNVVLQSATSVEFDAAQIVSTATSPLSLTVNADGSIFGDGFSISSLYGPLDMAFNADASGSNAETGGIYFNDATLSSNGGNILMYGQSDANAGYASAADNGISLEEVSITTDGGDVVLRGASTGTRGAQDNAGVSLVDTDIDSAAGSILVSGTGEGSAHGVFADGSSFATGAGNLWILGVAGDTGDGVRLQDTGVSSGGADVLIDGDGGGYGVYVSYYGALQSGGGDIIVHGQGGTGAGTFLTGGVESEGGDIDVYGNSTAAEGLVINGGFFDGISSGGGDIRLQGVGATGGALLIGSGYGSNSIDSAGGLITILGTASATDAVGVLLSSLAVVGGSGDVRIDGTSPAGIGVLFDNGAGVSTTTGAIGLYGTGANFGLDIADGALDTDSGDITLEGTATAATATAGVRVTGDGLTTNGGDIRVTGTSAGGVGVQLGDGGAFAIGSGGGDITIEGISTGTGPGANTGVLMQGNQLASGGGAVSITGEGENVGVALTGSDVDSGAGDITIRGDAISGFSSIGVSADDTRVGATTGDILVTGIGNAVGLRLRGGEVTTESGHIDLRGRGTIGGAGTGLEIGQGVRIATESGGIDLSGTGNRAGGILLRAGSSIEGGDSLVVLRADSGPGDAIDIQGNIQSNAGVNLRPGGVDASGALTDAISDRIVLGTNVGQVGDSALFLSNAELALIDTPELIIGSNLHAGAIQVLGGVSREGNLTLQNNGGTGGIDLQAALNVGNGTLALSSGGSITQTSAGVISAHSLLAQAGGDVLLATALNDVANTTLAGSAGGDFEFQDANTLAIGSVSGVGFDASTGQLSNLASTGISAGGDAFVRNLQGDLTLNAGVTATNIDLVTAGRLQNVAGASLVASGDWRVWANTWQGETRGGLAGDGNLPNLYGCAYLGACGVTVSSGDNHFIYVQQPIALITFDNATREYGLPNPLFTFSVTGAILGDTAANVASGTATTTATIGSDVGLYPILGNFTSAAGYQIQFVPGTLAITPATLLFTADGAIRYLGFPNPDFTGTVTGFRNGDTVASVFGNTVIWSSPAGPLSPIGYYPVVGGTTAKNYVFAQAPGNATALQIVPLPQLPATPIEFIRETINTYVYDRNFGGAPVCAVNASIDDTGLASSGDGLSTEWTKVRSRPNLTNCFDSERENGCGSF